MSRHLATIFFLTFSHDAAARETLTCEITASRVIEQRISSDSFQFVFTNISGDAIYEVLEQGHDLLLEEQQVEALDTAATVHEIGSRPPRLGIRLAPATNGMRVKIRPRRENPKASELGILRLHCHPSPELQEAERCLLDAERAETAQDAEAFGSVPLCAAMALHSAAASSYRQGDQTEAERLYRQTIARWTQQGDQARAGAATLGLAESLFRQGRHHDALEQARSAESLSTGANSPYFAARAATHACLMLRYLGRFQDANRCVDELPQRYVDLGEISEAANTLIMKALWAREESDPSSAEKALAELHALPRTEISDLVLGRGALLNAAMSTESGDLHGAFRHYEDALASFERVPSPSWMANAYLGAARLHALLGAIAEAELLANVAAERFGSIQMPQLQASALLLRARIEVERGERVLAMNTVERALALLGDAANPQTAMQLAIIAWSLEPTGPRRQRIDAIRASGAELSSRIHQDLFFAETHRALDEGATPDITAALSAHEAEIVDFARRVELEQLHARALALSGRPAAARDRLDSAIAQIRNVATRSGSPALRQIAGRRLLQLRAAWIDSLSEDDESDGNLAADAARMLLSTDPRALLRSPMTESSAETDADQDALNTILARLLIESDKDDDELLAAQRAIWVRYTRTSPTPTESTKWSRDAWSALSGQLPPGTTLLMIGLGNRRSMSLLARNDRLDLHLLPDAATIRHEAEKLTELTSSRDTPVWEIDSAAQRLVAVLLPEQAGAVPDHLLLLLDETLSNLPFPLLRWPGQAGPLLDTTRISLVSSTVDADLSAHGSHKPHLRMLIAPKPIAAGAGMPRLYGAEHEPVWVQEALPTHAIDAGPLSESALRAALVEPGAWVHVAGHGNAHGGLQGHAGLWAEPVDDDDPNDPPRFISWLGLVEQPLHARLVVLNACTLGGTGTIQMNRAVSFAAAIQAAGASHVIAALWPVSDGAAALWVPTFYQNLGHSSEHRSLDPAGALREAQLRLRNSRAFRHPFFWASLVHFTHL